jgi:gamma-glutamylcyclotransferase (GGCT)/AIG2-like uncharacterized protein YtfP
MQKISGTLSRKSEKEIIKMTNTQNNKWYDEAMSQNDLCATEALKITDMVFVYGTLKRGYCNHDIMTRSGGEFLSVANTPDDQPLKMIQHSPTMFPYLLEPYFNGEPTEGKIKIYGELFKVEDIFLLDRLEGHPYHYSRALMEFVSVIGERIKAWVYIKKGTSLSDESCPSISSWPSNPEQYKRLNQSGY